MTDHKISLQCPECNCIEFKKNNECNQEFICAKCNKKYTIDELKSANQHRIDESLQQVNDARNEVENVISKAFSNLKI